jgi:ubiquinone/menaquinone biosynthesis C-methylase UbiE
MHLSMSTAQERSIRAIAANDLHAAVIDMFRGAPRGRILDVPAGEGALALALIEQGYDDIHCLDINAEAFRLHDERVRFRRHDVIERLPYPDGHFDYVFSIEGIEHFENPWTFTRELCRVLKAGGRLYISTPNTFSVDARLKYLVSGYFPRFKPLMQHPYKVMDQSVDEAHISPIYFWQLNYFLIQGGVKIERVNTNAFFYKPQWIKRVMENWIARIIRNNIRKRHFPDHCVTSEAMLFGDCIVIEGKKAT